jgi:hypothetical protein
MWMGVIENLLATSRPLSLSLKFKREKKNFWKDEENV